MTEDPKCACGCGQVPPIITRTDRCNGRIKGQYSKFVNGHQNRSPKPPYILEDRGYDTPCWIWQRGKEGGYGRLGKNGKNILAHVYYHSEKYGPIPKGMQRDHLCEQTDCCNPDHIEVVTGSENVMRGKLARVTRDRCAAITHCPHGHEYTERNTIRDNKTGWRECRICENKRQRRKKQEKRQKDMDRYPELYSRRGVQ